MSLKFVLLIVYIVSFNFMLGVFQAKLLKFLTFAIQSIVKSIIYCFLQQMTPQIILEVIYIIYFIKQ